MPMLLSLMIFFPPFAEIVFYIYRPMFMKKAIYILAKSILHNKFTKLLVLELIYLNTLLDCPIFVWGLCDGFCNRLTNEEYSSYCVP